MEYVCGVIYSIVLVGTLAETTKLDFYGECSDEYQTQLHVDYIVNDDKSYNITISGQNADMEECGMSFRSEQNNNKIHYVISSYMVNDLNVVINLESSNRGRTWTNEETLSYPSNSNEQGVEEEADIYTSIIVDRRTGEKNFSALIRLYHLDEDDVQEISVIIPLFIVAVIIGAVFLMVFGCKRNAFLRRIFCRRREQTSDQGNVISASTSTLASINTSSAQTTSPIHDTEAPVQPQTNHAYSSTTPSGKRTLN